MSIDRHRSSTQPTAAQCDDVSLRIDPYRIRPGFSQQLGELRRAPFFHERGSGDLGQHHVVGHRGGLQFVDRTECPLHGRVLGEFRYSCCLGSRLGCRVEWLQRGDRRCGNGECNARPAFHGVLLRIQVYGVSRGRLLI